MVLPIWLIFFYVGTLVFDQPSVKDAAAHIHSLLLGRQKPLAPPVSQPKSLQRTSQPPGISFTMTAKLPCNFHPSGNQPDPISTVPYNRWDLESLNKSGKAVSRARFGGWIQGVDLFDSSLFGVSAPEAELMDPQQRLLLEAAWEAAQVITFSQPS